MRLIRITLSSEKLKKQVRQLLAEQPLSLKELAVKMNVKEKKAFNLLKSLFENGLVSSFKDQDNQRRYRVKISLESPSEVEDEGLKFVA